MAGSAISVWHLGDQSGGLPPDRHGGDAGHRSAGGSPRGGAAGGDRRLPRLVDHVLVVLVRDSQSLARRRMVARGAERGGERGGGGAGSLARDRMDPAPRGIAV